MNIKKKLFMLNKLLIDLRKSKEIYKLAEEIHSQELGQYYFLFQENRIARGKDQSLIKIFDDNGIPLNRTYIDVHDKRYVYFPISIGQMGLAVFHAYLANKSDVSRERFLNFVHWFEKHAHITQVLGARWLTEVPLPQYKNPGPWQSAFAQSRAISILLRGYQLSGRDKYAELAEKALLSFTKAVKEGGVTSFTAWGPFYEEYTAAVATLVLNGKIFALCGVYDFVRVFPENTLAKKIFNDGIETLKKILPEYDLGFWSRYNLCQARWYPEVDPATLGYQRLHATQLRLLYHITGEKIFEEYAQKFKAQEKLVNIIRMYRIKYNSLKKIGRL
jgi:heparosan-N-sulfate-glucuronate 5-epimerase